MKINMQKLDKDNLPELGEEVLAIIRTIGVRKVYLMNDPDQFRGFFSLNKPKSAWFCKKDNCFYALDMVESICRLNQTNNTVNKR